jgi:hypothetical protein
MSKIEWEYLLVERIFGEQIETICVAVRRMK